MLQSYLFDRRMLSGRFGAREGLAPVNEVAVTDPLDHTISTVYDAEDRVLAQRGTTYPGSGKYKGSEIIDIPRRILPQPGWVARGSGTGEYVEVNMSLRMAAEFKSGRRPRRPRLPALELFV